VIAESIQKGDGKAVSSAFDNPKDLDSGRGEPRILCIRESGQNKHSRRSLREGGAP